jgi:hypothetical protein
MRTLFQIMLRPKLLELAETRFETLRIILAKLLHSSGIALRIWLLL